MRRARSVFLLVSCAFVFANRHAGASISLPQYSSFDSLVVGAPGGMSPGYVVIPRDMAGVPDVGVPVTLIFLDPGIVLSETQEEGTVVDCAARSLTRLSGPEGVTVFHPAFGGSGGRDAVELRCRGVFFGRLPARSTDIDASGTTDLADLSLFAEVLFSPWWQIHFDFNLDGEVGLPDLDILRRDLFSGSLGSSCP